MIFPGRQSIERGRVDHVAEIRNITGDLDTTYITPEDALEAAHAIVCVKAIAEVTSGRFRSTSQFAAIGLSHVILQKRLNIGPDSPDGDRDNLLSRAHEADVTSGNNGTGSNLQPQNWTGVFEIIGREVSGREVDQLFAALNSRR